MAKQSSTAKVETYGAPYDPKSTQVIYELYWFARGGSEGLSKQEHFKNICVLGYPSIANNWHEWYEASLNAWCDYDEIGTTGAASTHKTHFFTCLALTEWLSAPNRTRVVISAPTVPALRGSVWARIKSHYAEIQRTVGGFAAGYNMLDSKTTLQYVKGDDENAIIAVAVDSGSIDQAIGKVQGKHPARVIMIVDEAAQTQPAIFFARANLRTGTSFFRFVAIANASDQFDAHGQFCEPKDGWNSIDVNSDSWDTKTGICLHYNGLKSPNVKLGEKRYPKLFSQDDVDVYRKNYGENSREWWMYVLGFWPPIGLQDTVLDGATINAGLAQATAQWVGPFKRKAFLDPAFSTGGDRCILRFGKMGQLIEGSNALVLWDRIHIQLIEDPDNPKSYQIANRVIKECTDRGVTISDFGMDATGAGPLADMIEQLWGGKIGSKLSFGGSASDRPISSKDQRPANKVCSNKVTELWYRVAKMVEERLIRQMDAATAREFCMRRVKLVGERRTVEPKADMKLRTKGVSPDDADPVAGLADMFANEFGGEAKGADSSAESWEAAANQFALEDSYSFE